MTDPNLFDVPAHEGKFYSASIPDTLNLPDRVHRCRRL